MKRLFVTLFLACFSIAQIQAQTATSESDLRRHIEILASDRFQGREPGTIGEAVASHYIAAQFAQAGLEPGNGGSFYQPVPLINRSLGTISLVIHTADRGDYIFDEHSIVALGSRSTEAMDSPIVFAGYATDYGDPDGTLAGVDLSGAAVIFLRGTPPGTTNAPNAVQRSDYLTALGATAIIGVHPESVSWDIIRSRYQRGITELGSTGRSSIEAGISYGAAEEILEAHGFSIEAMIEQMEAGSFRALPLPGRLTGTVTTGIHRYQGYNVIGRLPGRGTSNEAVLFAAHYDHFGVCGDADSEDRICNGAVDNASGTAAIIEVAQGLAQDAPFDRDVIFLATTAEERGLLGAYHYLDNPSVPLSSIIAAFNLDSIAIAPADEPVGIVGRGLTPMDNLVDSVARELGREVSMSTASNAFVGRQDGWAFLSRDIPAIMVGGSFVDQDRLNAYFDGAYHSSDDDPDANLELGGAFQDVLLHIGLARAFADAQRYSPPPR